MKKEITVSIYLPQEERLTHIKVQAEMVGDFFAVHLTKLPGTEFRLRGVESSDVFKIGYSVTHVNTGNSVAEGFTKESAIEFATLLSTMLPAELQKTTNPYHSKLIRLVSKYYSEYTKNTPYWYAIPEEVSIKSLISKLTEVYHKSNDSDNLGDLIDTIMKLSGFLVEDPNEELGNSLLARAQVV